MTNPPKYWNKAKKYLSKKDKTMSKLIKNYQNPSEIILKSRKDIFYSLCKSIIGQQISEMILLFTYNRSNIWPVQDIGLLRAISKNYKKAYLPPEKFINTLKKRFSPYCSVATWYLWRSIDPEPIQY